MATLSALSWQGSILAAKLFNDIESKDKSCWVRKVLTVSALLRNTSRTAVMTFKLSFSFKTSDTLGWLTNNHLRCFFALIVLLLANVVVAGKAISIDVLKPKQEVVFGVESLQETEKEMSIDAALNTADSSWTQLDDKINRGYISTAHWFKFDIENDLKYGVDRFLEISYPLLDNIALYIVQDNTLLTSYTTGDSVDFRHRPIHHRNFLFPISLPPNQTFSIYIRVQTSGALQVPITLWEPAAFYEQDAKSNSIYFMYFGALLVMGAFNLMLYFSLRDKSYLYYVFFVFSLVVLVSSINGYGFQYVYSFFPGFHTLLILAAVPLAEIAICLFTVEFLRLSFHNLVLYRVFIVFVALAVLSAISTLVFPYAVATQISLYMALPITLLAMYVGVRYWNNDDIGAKMFSIAWFAFLVGVIATVLNRIGVLPASSFTEHSIVVSSTAQTVLFAVALASRFNSERDARMQAQQEHLEEMRKRRDAETQVVHAASHHELTGLPNRLLFEKSLTPYIQTPPDGRANVALVLMHVKRFDDVNKTLGHRNADLLLRKIGERIDLVVGGAADALPIDVSKDGAVYVAHVEGVTFGFALANNSREVIEFEVEGLLRLMTEPLEFMGLSLELGFWVGCSFVENQETDSQALLRQAFIAFDQAGRQHLPIAVYEPSMNPYSPKRLTLMTELRAAIDYDGLELFFQPQIDIKTGSVSGFEALLRWTHHEYGFVPPDEFIPMAEKTGLMKPITRWVIKNAAEFCRRLKAIGHGARVSVNVSALNLREPGFCRQVKDILSEKDVDISCLVLEVTETAAMIDPEGALLMLSELQCAGVRLSIDDFGTGHSSLSYIRKLPVHEIKIDRSFVGEMDQNSGDETIVRTTINMCHDLGFEVVAEGVENEKIMGMLRSMECDIVQGYHIARPMSVKDTLEWIEKGDWS